MNNESVLTQSYLSFKLGEEMFAADVEKVKEILQLIKITKVPQSPSYMLGVVNLRGIVLPVVDTREKFRLPINETTENTCIIVLNIEMDNETLLIGALVDSVLEVFELSDDLIKPAPSIGNKYKSEFIKGMVKKEEDFIMLLDMDKVFSSDELLDMRESTSESTNSY
jgi:purine-binding chemotaxis protein CheW